MKYLVLLRGVNVGGKAMIKMAELKVVLEKAGLESVQTYIQSGNVIFESDEKVTDKLSGLVADVIKEKFNLSVGAAVFSQADWKSIIDAAPEWWGRDEDWKHNLLILLKPFDRKDTLAVFEKLKPEIEKVEAGQGVLYQSLLFQRFGQTSSSKLISSPAYKRMTIRNYNTATKLGNLLQSH
jgi:uncharacterized protein (DUF1697 family)